MDQSSQDQGDPKIYSLREAGEMWQEGFNAGRRSVWVEVQDHGCMAAGVIAGLYSVGCTVYVSVRIVGWLLGW